MISRGVISKVIRPLVVKLKSMFEGWLEAGDGTLWVFQFSVVLTVVESDRCIPWSYRLACTTWISINHDDIVLCYFATYGCVSNIVKLIIMIAHMLHKYLGTHNKSNVIQHYIIVMIESNGLFNVRIVLIIIYFINMIVDNLIFITRGILIQLVR